MFLVIVRNLDVIRIAVRPAKANAPLVIDSNAVLTCPITDQFLKPVSGRHAKIAKRLGGMNQKQFSQCGPLHIPAEAGPSLALKYLFSIAITEALDHANQ